MTALKAYQVTKYIKKPESSHLAYLVYGSSEEKKNFVKDNLINHIKKQGFSEYKLINNDDLKENSLQNLIGEGDFFSPPSFGIINVGAHFKPEWVVDYLDLMANQLKTAQNPSKNAASNQANDSKVAPIIIIAGDLKPKQKLRTLLENHANAVTLPCFELSHDDKKANLANLLTANKISANNAELMDILLATINERKLDMEQSIKLLALYLGENPLNHEAIKMLFAGKKSLKIQSMVDDLLVKKSSYQKLQSDLIKLDDEEMAELFLLLTRELDIIYSIKSRMIAQRLSFEESCNLQRPPVLWSKKEFIQKSIAKHTMVELTNLYNLSNEAILKSRISYDNQPIILLDYINKLLALIGHDAMAKTA